MVKNFKKHIIKQNEILDMNERASLLSIHPSIWSCLYRKDFLKENNIRFIEMKGQNWVDNPFQAECFILAKNFVYVSDAFYYYRVNREGSSSCFSKNLDIPLTAVKMVVLIDFTQRDCKFLVRGTPPTGRGNPA